MNQKEFQNLGNKVLGKLKEHPKVVSDNLYVECHGHDIALGGIIFEIEGNIFLYRNNGDEANWNRVR